MFFMKGTEKRNHIKEALKKMNGKPENIDQKTKVALITGITGQDGSYLTEFLLEKNYQVHGIIRRSSSFNTGRIEHLLTTQNKKNPRLFLHYGDLTDATNLTQIITRCSCNRIKRLTSYIPNSITFTLRFMFFFI